MKRAVIVAVLLLLPVLWFAERDEEQDAIDALLETIDLSAWDAWFRENGIETDVLPSGLLKQLVTTQTMFDSGFTGKDLLSKLKPSLSSAVAKTALYLGLAAIGAVIGGVSDSSSIGETAGTAFRISVSVAVLAVSLTEIRRAFSTVAALEHISEMILPPIVGYLTLTGQTNTALLLPASQAMLSELILRFTESCIAPLAIIGGVLIVLDANGTGRLSALGKLMQRAAKWALGTACSLYMITAAVRSAAARSADSMLMKTTKSAAGSIPAIGSLLSESVDTVYACMHFVKNALGLTGCAVLLFVAMNPVLSIFAARSSLRAAALLSEPLSGKPYAELLRGMGDTLHILMLSELAAFAAAVMMLSPMLGAGA